MILRTNYIGDAIFSLINGSLLQQQKNDGLYGSHARKLSVAPLSTNSRSKAILPTFGYVIEYTPYSSFGASRSKNIYLCGGPGLLSSFLGPFSCKAIDKNFYREDMPHVVESCKRLVNADSTKEEVPRRKNFGHGNKGKVPWNKGRKHSEETLERIRHRTKEALKDPKVRKKMSECPRTLSDQTKVKIRISLRKLWGKRLQWTSLREKILQSWAESIAQAAKRGGSDQHELDWDSYDKIKQEIAILHINEAAEKAKAKQMVRIRAERATVIKAERMARLAQNRREREENAKVRGESTKKRNKKSKEEKEKLAEFHEIKLKERLLKLKTGRDAETAKLVKNDVSVFLEKLNLGFENDVRGKCQRRLNWILGHVKQYGYLMIHKKKSTINQVSNQHNRSWQKVDLDFVKAEQLQKEISLADQIRSAKNRRA